MEKHQLKEKLLQRKDTASAPALLPKSPRKKDTEVPLKLSKKSLVKRNQQSYPKKQHTV